MTHHMSFALQRQWSWQPQPPHERAQHDSAYIDRCSESWPGICNFTRGPQSLISTIGRNNHGRFKKQSQMSTICLRRWAHIFQCSCNTNQTGVTNPSASKNQCLTPSFGAELLRKTAGPIIATQGPRHQTQVATNLWWIGFRDMLFMYIVKSLTVLITLCIQLTFHA
jgi:hypothetical protein